MLRRTLVLSLLLPGLFPCLQAESLESLLKSGDEFDKQQRAQQALDCYLAAEKQSPSNARLMVSIAMQYSFLMTDATDKVEKGRLGRLSLSYAQKAVKLNPDLCDAHLCLAVSHGKLLPLMAMKDRIAASRTIKTAADRAVALDPGNDLAWHILARWHQLLANITGFKKALAELVYGSLPKASSEEAVQYFEKAIALDPGRLMHYVELGRTYAQMGNTDKALEYLKKGLAMPDREKDDPDTKKRGRETLEKLSS